MDTAEQPQPEGHGKPLAGQMKPDGAAGRTAAASEARQATRGIHPLPQLMRVIARNGKRVAVFVVGWVLVAAGLAMLVLPGPGLLVTILGLAVLATEFAWAERQLDRAKTQAMKARNAATGAMNRSRPKP